MNECMDFPDTVEEFMEKYKIVDKEQIYSNGMEFVPIFRMEQWFEHSLNNTCPYYNSTEGHCTVENTASNEATQRIIELENEIRMLRQMEEYHKGMIDGLRFSVRCNGVSGDEVI